MQSAFSLKIRLVLISASPTENHDVILYNTYCDWFLAIVVLDSDESEENEESILPQKIRKVSKKSCSRRLIYRLFTVPYFRVISSRWSAVRYGLPSCTSIKTTNPCSPPPRYIKISLELPPLFILSSVVFLIVV